MHRAIGYISKRFTHIRPGEGRKVLLTFSYFFLIITAYYVIKPVSRSLVLDDLGHRVVPYADLICAILMGPVVAIFARLVDCMPKMRLISVSFAAVGAAMLLFWRLLAWPYPWIAGLFYIWVAIFSVLVVTMFWLVANDLYRPRDAKRLFGFIGSGGILGGIAGSSIAAAGAQVVGTENLLLLSVGFLAASWLVVRQLWQFAPGRTAAERDSPATARHDTYLANLRGLVGLLTQSRYLLLLVSIVALSKLISSLVYYQVNPFIEQTFPDVDAKTTFTAIFLGGINVLAFIVQFFCTSWLLRRWGLLWALLILPLGLLVAASGLLMVPVFLIAAGSELFDKSLNYSLHNTAKEVLYLPIDRSVRYKVKPFIDMVMFRFGKGFAAVLGIVLLDLLKMPVQRLGFVTIPLLALWVFIAVRMSGEYTLRIRTLLQARANARRGRRSSDTDEEESGEELATAIGSLAISREPQPKLSLATQLFEGVAGSPHARALLEGLTRYEALVTNASQFRVGTELEQLKRVTQDQAAPMAMRRLAVRILGHQLNQEALDYLCGMLIVERETTLTHEVARALVRIRLARRGLQFPVTLIRRQIAREVANYQRIIEVARICRRHHRGAVAAVDPIIEMLRVLMEESVEQIFRLLMLLYRPEDIHLVYEQLRTPDTHLRADAIELLDNLVDPPMRGTIFPILDEDRFLSLLDEDVDGVREPTAAYQVLQEAIWDHNSWLSVTTLCAVGRLRLTPMREELEKASEQPELLMSNAAKAALQLTTHP